ncbi:MAG: hypothetical protein KDD66_13360 [Bdellovibrionales bacterium]|nr:hypothetical protein [Bdellovibrionales bacterium]
MRVGIYLRGRTDGGVSPVAESRAFAAGVLEHLAAHSLEDEVVLYGGGDLLTPQFVHDLSFGPVLTSEAIDGGALTGASRFFRRLPNGARSRVLFRVLRTEQLYKLRAKVDQLPLLFYSLLDQLDVMHLVGHNGYKSPTVPLIVSDQAGEHAVAPRHQKTQTQAKSSKHVIVPCEDTAVRVYRDEGIDPSEISIIHPGADRLFELSANSVSAGYAPAVYEGLQADPGYVLLLLPYGLNDAAKAAIEAWQSLDPEKRSRGLVVAATAKVRRKEVLSLFDAGFDADAVDVLIGVSYDSLSSLIFNSTVLYSPNFRPADSGLLLGALALQTSVVADESLRSMLPQNDRLFLCKSGDPASAAFALGEALGRGTQSLLKDLMWRPDAEHSPKLEQLRRGSQRRSRLERPEKLVRTIGDVVRETFDVYRRVHLRYKVR